MLTKIGCGESEVQMRRKDQNDLQNTFNQVPMFILEFYHIENALFKYNSPTFIFLRCNFDILKLIEDVSAWRCFYGKLKDRKRTRDILYQIADTITGNTGNPRRAYGTRIHDVLAEVERQTSEQKTVILTRELDPRVIPKIANLNIGIRIIGQPLRGWTEISRHNKNGLCRLVTIDSSAPMLESILRAYSARTSRGHLFNPWGNITPQAVVRILFESNWNLSLFIRIMEQIIQHKLVSTENINDIVVKAWKTHLEKDISKPEWYILKNLPLHSTEKSLKKSCDKISRTDFDCLFKSLLKRGLIQKSRAYDENGNKHIYLHPRPRVAELMEVRL